MKTGAVLVGGILAGWVLLGLHVGCGPAAQTDCTLRALTVLPTDPDLVSVGDARRLVQRLKQCQSQDGGK